MEFLQRSKFQYHGCLTSRSCMISGRWELKITDYGLPKSRLSLLDAFAYAAIRKRFPEIEDEKSSAAQLPRVVQSTQDLLWLAPETIVTMPFGIYLTYPTKRSDVYRQVIYKVVLCEWTATICLCIYPKKSVGIIMNEIVTRAKPYSNMLDNETETFESIFFKIRDLGLRPKLDTRATDEEEYATKMGLIISECLDPDPSARPTFSSLAVSYHIIAISSSRGLISLIKKNSYRVA